MHFFELPLPLLVTLWLTVCAVQDLRMRSVPNWLTLPPLPLAVFLAIVQGGEALLLSGIAVLVFLPAWYLRAMGGADVKVMIALAAFWPSAFLTGLLVVGVWSFTEYLCKRCESRARRLVPGLPPLALGAWVTLLWMSFCFPGR